MKKFAILLALVAVACTNTSHESAQNKMLNKKVERRKYVENQFVFEGQKAVVSSYLKNMGATYQYIPISEADHMYQVKYSGGPEVNVAVEGLKGRLDFVEPNYLNDLNYEIDQRNWPKDRFFFKQWYMNNIGQSAPYGLPGKRGADINVLKTWKKVTKGSENVVVALIDTGVDYKHPDLRDAMWVNEAEANGKNGVDDDDDGFVDDIYGYDFSSAGRTDLDYRKVGDSDPMDENGHGTHCAGVIGAKSNNDKGIAGINQKIQIMALKIFPANGGAQNADIARAIYYGISKKVDIMSNSYGGSESSELLNKAVTKATKSGILFVVAAGNDGKNTDVAPSYPMGEKLRTDSTKRVPGVLTVGASDNQDNPAEFSNYGPESVDVFAPGVLILSTYPTQMVDTGRRPYAIMSGTSMATPITAGIAALVLAANPSLKRKPEQLRRIMIETADVKQSLVGKAVSNGRVDAYRAATFATSKTQKMQNWQTKAETIDQRGFNKELFDIRHKITVEGAKAVQAHFNFVQIQEPYNSIYFYDKNMRFISSLEKTESVDAWSPVVPGDTLYIRYVNSKVKQMKGMINTKVKDEYSCNSSGGVMVESGQFGDKELCMMDSTDSSGDGSVIFNSLNSEGFSVDQVKYLN